jgi:hypothetical protein
MDDSSDLVSAKKDERLRKETITNLQFLDNLILSRQNERKASGMNFYANRDVLGL